MLNPSKQCEFCGRRTREVLNEREEPFSYVRACHGCIEKLEAGEALLDAYDFIWWKDEKGFHGAHKDDERAPKDYKEVEDVVWAKEEMKETS